MLVVCRDDCATCAVTDGERPMTGFLRWAGGDDQYYWLTAFLAAHDAQTFMRRLIAAISATIGLIPTLLIASPGGPRGLPAIFVSLLITGCCLAMATLWLRPRWPSRLQSQLCVIAGSLGVAAACLTQNPVFGLVGSNVFAIVASFAGFFLSLRLLVFTWSVASATLLVLSARLSETSISLATVGVLTVALVNVFAVAVCRMVLRLIDNQIRHTDIEPVTGLLNRDAFGEQVATLIGARNRVDDRYLVVVVVDLDSYSALMSVSGATAATRARVIAGQKLRETVRRDTPLAHMGEADFLIADVFDAPDPSALIERIRSALAAPPSRVRASIGTVSTPLPPLVSRPPHAVVDEVLAIATAAMHEARRAGGDQHRLIVNPPLTVLDEPESDWPPDERRA